jgi:hypothetical protein
MTNLIIVLSSIILGFQLKSLIDNLLNIRKEKKRKKLKNKVFSDLHNNLIFSKFKSRINNTVYISSRLSDEGDIDIIYLIDKSDIHIFKNGDCIYTSDDVDKKTIDNIIEVILLNFKNNINDVVTIFGTTFNRDEFQNYFKSIEDIKNLIEVEPEKSDIDQIYHENETKFDIDEILDRINTVGIKNITQAELKFLKEYSGKKD